MGYCLMQEEIARMRGEGAPPKRASSLDKVAGYRPTKVQKARVLQAAPTAPVAVDAPCVVRVDPTWKDDETNCSVRVACADTLVYRNAWSICPQTGPLLRIEDLQFSGENGSPRLVLDFSKKTGELEERHETNWTMRLALED